MGRDAEPQAAPPPIQMLMSSRRDGKSWRKRRKRGGKGAGGWPSYLDPQEGGSAPRSWAYGPQGSLPLQLAPTVYIQTSVSPPAVSSA